MKAFVLAAGAGTRLRPLTSDIPKPMVPIVGKPALQHTLENLKKYGFKDVCVNLYHCPGVIVDYFKDNDTGLNIKYSLEEKLLGTAGAIKKQENFFDETFVVMSGDGLTDINLKKALEFHKKKKSIATIVLKEIDARFEYGITLTDKNGKIKSFVEKPRWKDIFADTVNTGIYIFEPEIFKYIPKDKFFDFSMDLFPLFLKNKKNIYGYVMKEYWTDIGNILEYKKGVFDALDGNVNVNISSSADKKLFGKNVKINSPCFIGKNVRIGNNVVIHPYSVITENCEIGDNAVIEKTIIWSGSKIGKNVRLSNTIVGYDSTIPGGIVLFDSIIMGRENFNGK
ncbi:MAG: NDP-sugar synthase [Endomicrobia bacterium]|nr:NDP-sugar synthase [Endomicrobiia bacterium]MCL2506446.1 NDP-sugar synthase [Endomicrobiia bacterium]